MILPLFKGPHTPPWRPRRRPDPILFPVVLLLGLTGLLVGILQSYDEFSIPAIAPAVWNLVILVRLVGLHQDFSRKPDLRLRDRLADRDRRPADPDRLGPAADRLSPPVPVDWRDPRVKQVFPLMLPVTIGLGIVNLDH